MIKLRNHFRGQWWNNVRLNVVQRLVPPVLIVKDLVWVYHQWKECALKHKAKATRLKIMHVAVMLVHSLTRCTSGVSPSRATSIWLTLHNTNFFSDSIHSDMFFAHMKAPIVTESLKT